MKKTVGTTARTIATTGTVIGARDRASRFVPQP